TGAIRQRLEALLGEHRDDIGLRFFAAVFRLLEKDASGLAELEALAGAGPELERAFEPASRLDLANVDRLEALEWTAFLDRREPLLARASPLLATIHLRLGRRDLAEACLEPLAA